MAEVDVRVEGEGGRGEQREKGRGEGRRGRDGKRGGEGGRDKTVDTDKARKGGAVFERALKATLIGLGFILQCWKKIRV